MRCINLLKIILKVNFCSDIFHWRAFMRPPHAPQKYKRKISSQIAAILHITIYIYCIYIKLVFQIHVYLLLCRRATAA